MARQWPAQEIPWIINQASRQVLERSVLDHAGAITDANALMTYGCALMNGHMSVRDLVRALATSQEHIGKIADSMPFQEALSRCFEHILGRPIDQQARDYYTDRYEHHHWSIRDIVNDVINSQEYSDVYGDDTVPSRRIHAH